MEGAQKRQRTEEECPADPPDDKFVVSAQGGDGATHVLTDLGEEHTVGDVKTALSRQTEMAAETQKLYVVNDKRDRIDETETGGELEDDELLGTVIHYNPICYSSKRLELLVTNFELEEWKILVEMRDATGFADWTCNEEGWGTLEEHKDPSRCEGVTIESGKITKIELCESNLAGALPKSIGNLQNLTLLDVQGNALQGNCRVVPSRTSCLA
jgi:hypothetical protein